MINNNPPHTSARTKCEVWSRIVGYLRPTNLWNEGKQEEFKDRLEFKPEVTKQ